MTVELFNPRMRAVDGDLFDRDFIDWLRTLVNQSNYALTFEAVQAALAAAGSPVDFNGQSLTVGAGSESAPALVIGALASGGMYSTSNTLYWTTNGTTRMRLNGGNLFVYGAIGVTNGQVFLYGTGNGILKLSDVDDDGFDRIQFGGDTNAFPSLKRSGTRLKARLADDSADSAMTAAGPTAINDVLTAKLGDIRVSLDSVARTGELLADGTDVNRTTYAALFGLIGTTFGAGDGATTFALPNPPLASGFYCFIRYA